jgi:hypothetical protein
MSHPQEDLMITLLTILRKSHNFRMLLELPEDLLAQGIGDLGVDAGVLNVLVPKVVSDILNPTASFQKMHGHGVAQGMDRTFLDAGGVGIIVKELLDLPLLQGPLAAGEEIRPHIAPFAEIGSQELGRVPPQGFLSAEAVLQSPNGDPMILEVHIVNGEHERLTHTQAVVVDETEEGPVARRGDRREEAFHFILGEIFG